MSAAAALAILIQVIEPQPKQAEVGATVCVAVRDRHGAGIAGIEVTVRRPDGSRRVAGRTGPDGAVDFVADMAGSYRLEAQRREVVLVAPFHAVAPERRHLHALWCLPVAAVAIWLHLRGLGHDRRRRPAQAGVRRSGPSPPAP